MKLRIVYYNKTIGYTAITQTVTRCCGTVKTGNKVTVKKEEEKKITNIHFLMNDTNTCFCISNTIAKSIYIYAFCLLLNKCTSNSPQILLL